MGQGHSSLVKEADALLDYGRLDEAEKKCIVVESMQAPSNASNDLLLSFAAAKLEANMNLGIICMCRGQYSQAERYLASATQIEVKHSDSLAQHHVNTLAVFYHAVLCSISSHDVSEKEHLFSRLMHEPYVMRALENRLEHANLIYCAQAWLLFILQKKPVSLALAPILRAEHISPRIHYNAEDVIKATIAFEVDAELEVDLGADLDDDIGDIPSDHEDDIIINTDANDEDVEDDSDGLSTGSNRPKNDDNDEFDIDGEDVPSSIKKNQSLPNSPSKASNNNTAQENHINNLIFAGGAKSNPNIQLMKAIVLTLDPNVELVQVQALAQAARAISIQLISLENASGNYIGAVSPLYVIWKSRAKHLKAEGKHQAALVAFAIALACNWVSISAWVDLATAYAELGLFDKARQHLSIVTDMIAPNESLGWLERGNVCMKCGRYAEAAMCFDRIILDIEPKNVDAWEKRASATLKLRRWNTRAIAETLNLTNQALMLNPDHLESLKTRAQALIEQGYYKEAVDDFEKVLLVSPDNVEAIHGLATAFRNLRQYNDALTWYQKAHTLNPRSPDIALHLALSYLEMSTNFETDPDDPAFSSSHLVASESKANGTHSEQVPATENNPPLRKSISILNSVNSDPSTFGSAPFVGTLPFNRFDYEGYPTLLSVMRHLHTKPRLNDVESGLEATEIALEVCAHEARGEENGHHYYEPSSLPRTDGDYSDDPGPNTEAQEQFVVSQIWATRALLLAHANRPSEAISATEHAIEESAKFPSLAWVCRGDVLFLCGKPAEEIHECYLKALELDPLNEFAHLSMIHLLLFQKEAKEALKYTSKLVKLAEDGYLINPNLAIEIHASTLFHLRQYTAAYQVAIDHLPALEDSPHKSSPRSSPSDMIDPDLSDKEDEVYYVRLLNIAAHSKHHLGKCEEAQSLFDRALRSQPMNVSTWNEKARCLLQEKRFDDALNYFDRALVMDGENVMTICNRALCICMLGNIQEGSTILSETEKSHHSMFMDWLGSLSPTERAFHYDSMSAARELEKKKQIMDQSESSTEI